MAVLVKPLITEKMSLLAESKGHYGFRVALTATKPEIKSEIEKMYNVEVTNIRTLVVQVKEKQDSLNQVFLMVKRLTIKKLLLA